MKKATEKTPGETVKTYRLKLKLTQAALARELGVDASTVARWEQGVFIPSKPILTLLEILAKGGKR